MSDFATTDARQPEGTDLERKTVKAVLHLHDAGNPDVSVADFESKPHVVMEAYQSTEENAEHRESTTLHVRMTSIRPARPASDAEIDSNRDPDTATITDNESTEGNHR